tara:strand:- start:1450 stop:2787 length:1338 start_codon:yes stop_codon:yes gene_type:complete
MKDINLVRNKIISFKKEYLKKLIAKNIDAEISSLSCFKYLMYSNLKKQNNIRKITKNINNINFFKQLKNLLYIKNFSSVDIHGDCSKQNLAKYNRIIFSWSYTKNFKNNGLFTDPYFKITSNKKKILWILLHADDQLPKKFNKNLIIIQTKKSNIISGSINLLKYVLKLIKINKIKLFNIYHQLSFDSYLAHELKKHFVEQEFFKVIKKVYIPLESQPFQNSIIKLAKEENVKTIGFDHTHNPFPFWNSYSYLSPDILSVHSNCGLKIYSKYLGWPKNKLRKITSVRTEKRNKEFFSNKIFLPIIIGDFNKVFLCLDILFKNYLSKLKIKPLKVCLHPATQKIKKYKNFEKKIYKLQNKYLSFIKKNNKNSASIHIGNISTVIESLECKTPKVIHITTSEILDFFSSKLWIPINSKKISNSIFEYKLRKYGQCVIFKKKRNSLKL